MPDPQIPTIPDPNPLVIVYNPVVTTIPGPGVITGVLPLPKPPTTPVPDPYPPVVLKPRMPTTTPDPGTPPAAKVIMIPYTKSKCISNTSYNTRRAALVTALGVVLTGIAANTVNDRTTYYAACLAACQGGDNVVSGSHNYDISTFTFHATLELNGFTKAAALEHITNVINVLS